MHRDERAAQPCNGLPPIAASIGLADLARESLERWLVSQEKAGMGAANPQHLSGRLPWPSATGASKPAGCWPIRLPRCRRPTKTPTPAGQRRALTEDELDAAAWTWHAAGRCWTP